MRNFRSLRNCTYGQGYSKERIEKATRMEDFLNDFDGDLVIPSFLNEKEVEDFKFLVDELVKIKLFNNLDSIIIAQYVNLYHQYLQALETLKEEGQFVEYTNKASETNVIESASSKLVRALVKDMQQLSKKLPFSPLDRLNFRDTLAEKEKTLSEILEEDDEE